MEAATHSSPPSGLTSQEAARRLARDGPNRLPPPDRPHPLGQLAAQLTHVLAVLLWVAAGLAVLAGMPQLAAAIVVIVVLNAVFAFWQEYRADRSAERLRGLLPARVQVVRDGVAQPVPVDRLVAGDLVLLTAGDRVGADMRVGNARQLAVDESLVTGESQPVPHRAGDLLVTGSFVVEGEADAVVEATGSRTTLAGISALAQAAERPPSPLSVQLSRVVRTVAVIAGVTGTLLGAAALALGLPVTEAFLFGVGVSVALVPEGLLPTVTLSLARGAQLMADRNALVRRLDAVETLGATTFICTDKTGTLTQNRMVVVDVVTAAGAVRVDGDGYAPSGSLAGDPEAVAAVGPVAAAAASCVTGRVVEHDGRWQAQGDPMEAALDCLARRTGAHPPARVQRRPFTSDRLVSSAQAGSEVVVLGAPEAVLSRCATVPFEAEAALHALTARGRRVLAVARRSWTGEPGHPDSEDGLTLLALLGLEDPPRPDVAEALEACRAAEVRVAMLTGDHPRTAEAVAREIGLLRAGGVVLVGGDLPDDDERLAEVLDNPAGAVVARVSPADKFRIAGCLRGRGHVVAMTGDGVNDAPALREADVGVAMGASGSDVAREAADLVLLDDHFATIVGAIELGRATFSNVRRFLTYHLTDNVAELAPFAVWALTGGNVPLAIGVLQVLALDIGTDMLPALALGAEPPSRRTLQGRHLRALVDRALLVRALAVLGLTEALAAMTAFTVVLVAGGWSWGATPSGGLLAQASGTAFAAIALAQMANAFCCRSTYWPLWRLSPWGNRLVLLAVAAEAVLLVAFLGVPAVADVLGGAWPPGLGWGLAGVAAVGLVVVDGVAKWSQRRRTAARAGQTGASDRDRPPERPSVDPAGRSVVDADGRDAL